jgi:hypothetical protein
MIMDNIKLPPKTEQLIKDRLAEDEYEVHPSYLVEKYVQNNHRVLEGGAGLGIVTNVIARTGAFVLAVEGHPEMYRCARDNVPYANAMVMHRTLTFKGVHIPHTGDAFGVEPIRLKNEANPNDLISEFDLNALVLDVEGEEANILLNVALPPLTLIIVEMHPVRCGWGPLEAANSRVQRGGFRKVENILDGDILHVAYTKGYSGEIKPLHGDSE